VFFVEYSEIRLKIYFKNLKIKKNESSKAFPKSYLFSSFDHRHHQRQQAAAIIYFLMLTSKFLQSV